MKTDQEMGIYRLSKKLAIAARKRQKYPSGRPDGRLAKGHFSDRCASGRPPGQPGQACQLTARLTGRTRELGAYIRSTVRSTGLVGWPFVYVSCTSVDRSGRPPQSLAGIFTSGNLVNLIPIKSHKYT